MYYETTLEIGEKGMGLIESEIFLYRIRCVNEVYGVNLNIQYQNEVIHSDRRQNGSTNLTFDEIVNFIGIVHPPYSRLTISIEGVDKDESTCRTLLSDLVENCKVERLADGEKGIYKFLKEI